MYVLISCRIDHVSSPGDVQKSTASLSLSNKLLYLPVEGPQSVIEIKDNEAREEGSSLEKA